MFPHTLQKPSMQAYQEVSLITNLVLVIKQCSQVEFIILIDKKLISKLRCATDWHQSLLLDVESVDS